MPSHDGKGTGPALLKCCKPNASVWNRMTRGRRIGFNNNCLSSRHSMPWRGIKSYNNTRGSLCHRVLRGVVCNEKCLTHGFLCHRIMATGPGFDSMFMASCLSMTSHDGAGPGMKKMLLAPGLGLKNFSLNACLCLLQAAAPISLGPTPMPLRGEGRWLLMKPSLAPLLSMPSHDGKGKEPALIKCFKPSLFYENA